MEIRLVQLFNRPYELAEMKRNLDHVIKIYPFAQPARRLREAMNQGPAK